MDNGRTTAARLVPTTARRAGARAAASRPARSGLEAPSSTTQSATAVRARSHHQSPPPSPPMLLPPQLRPQPWRRRPLTRQQARRLLIELRRLPDSAQVRVRRWPERRACRSSSRIRSRFGCRAAPRRRQPATPTLCSSSHVCRASAVRSCASCSRRAAHGRVGARAARCPRRRPAALRARRAAAPTPSPSTAARNFRRATTRCAPAPTA